MAEKKPEAIPEAIPAAITEKEVVDGLKKFYDTTATPFVPTSHREANPTVKGDASRVGVVSSDSKRITEVVSR